MRRGESFPRAVDVVLLVLLQILAVCLAQVPSDTKPQIRPELVLQGGHTYTIDKLAFSPDGRLIASGGISGEVLIWDVASGREVRALPNHTSPVFSHDGRMIATMARDRSVHVWDVASGQALRKLTGYKNIRSSLAFSPDGKWLAVCGWDGALIWELATGREARVFKDAKEHIAFSPDGRWLTAYGDSVKVWQVDTWDEVLSIKAGWVGSIVISSDSRRIITGIRDGRLRVWDITTGSELDARQAYQDGKQVSELAISRDGRWIAAGTSDGDVKIWNAVTLEQLNRAPEHIKGRAVLALSPDGRLLASTGSDPTIFGETPVIKLSELTSGREVRTLGSLAPNTRSVAFSPDARWLTIGGKEGVQFWEVATGQLLHDLKRDAGGVTSLAFRPDAKQLVTTHYGDRVKTWDVDSGKEVQTIASGGRRGSYNETAAYSPDGRLLAISKNMDIVLWDVTTGKELQTLQGHTKSVNGLAFSPDVKTLASSGGWDHTIKLWDIAKGREKLTLSAPSGPWEMGKVIFSPDGRYVVASAFNYDDDPSVIKLVTRIWNTENGDLSRELSGQPAMHTMGMDGHLLFTRDGRRLITHSQYDSVGLWDFGKGNQLRTLRHSAGIGGISFNPTETRMATAGGVCVQIWDPENGTLLATLASPAGGKEWLVATPDGLFDGSPGGWNQVLWRFNNNTFDTAPVEAFFSEYYYPGLLAEILAGKFPKAKTDISRKDRRQPQLILKLAEGTASNPVRTRQVKLKLEVQEAPADAANATSSSGVRDVRLFRNGSLVKVWRGDLSLGKDGRALLEATVSLSAGENKLSAYAFNRDNIKSADAGLTVTGADNIKRSGTAYVLAVGLNRYANSEYDLQFAAADAQTFAEQVSQQQGKLGVYAKVEVVLLQDSEATKANILMALRRLAGDTTALPTTAPAALKKLTQAQPEDAVMVYYAGHGTALGHRFFLIPHDLGYTGSITALNEAAIDTILGHSVSDVELEQAFEKIDAGQLLLVIDACNSGQALEAEEKRRGPMNSQGLAQLAYEKGINVLTAAQGYQAAIEATQYGHGLLTYALIDEGLKTGAADTQPKDGQVVVREWLDYATQRVPKLQEKMMRDFRKMGRELAFVEGEQKIQDLADRSLQRPRVFYRREPEAQPLVVAKPNGGIKPNADAKLGDAETKPNTPGLFESLGRLFKGKPNEAR